MASSEFDKGLGKLRACRRYHQDNPLHGGMRVAERQKLLKGADRQRADAILACLAREGKDQRPWPTPLCARGL